MEYLTTYPAIVDNALSTGTFLLDTYSIVDTHLYGIVFRLDMMGVALSSFRRVADWLRRCGKRPALAVTPD